MDANHAREDDTDAVRSYRRSGAGGAAGPSTEDRCGELAPGAMRRLDAIDQPNMRR